MTENEVVPSNHKLYKRIRVFLFGLLAFNFLLLAWNLTDFVRGEPDMYPNQHARLLIGNLGQICLVSAMLFSNQAQLSSTSARRYYTINGVLVFLSITLVSFQFWLTT